MTTQRTKNRKTITRNCSFNHNGNDYTVKAYASGIYSEIMHSIIEQLDTALDNWNRVLLYRFDLHMIYQSDNSKPISKFIKNLKRRLERQYGIYDIAYVWAREQSKQNKQHYHFAIMLDGNKVRNGYRLFDMVSDTWEAIKAGNKAYRPDNHTYFINSELIKANAIERVSYLAKVRTKGYRPAQAKDYSTSRLTRQPHALRKQTVRQ